MTSFFSRNHGLSEDTQEAYRRYQLSQNVAGRLEFYLAYLRDIAPHGITIHHIAATRTGAGQAARNEREEIQLLTSSGKIFMSGLVSMERRADSIETVAADEAYSKCLDEEFVDQNWRFFTGLNKIRIFNSDRSGDGWELVSDDNPIENADEVAAFLQEEYDRIEY